MSNVKNKRIIKSTGDPLSFTGFEESIKKFAWHKSSGLNDMTPNVAKSLDENNKRTSCDFVKEWMENNEVACLIELGRD